MSNPRGVAPIVIEFMFACYVSTNPAAHVGEHRWDSKSGMETRVWLRDRELIDNEDRSTSRGDAWVEFICETPLPEHKWVRGELEPTDQD